MQLTSARETGEVSVALGPAPPAFRRTDWVPIALLAVGALAGALILSVPAVTGGLDLPARQWLALLVATVEAGVILLALSTRQGAWVGTQLFAGGIVASAAVMSLGWLRRGHLSVMGFAQLTGLAAGILVVTFLAVLLIDFLEHIRRGRTALLSDMGLIALLAGSVAWLLMHDGTLSSHAVVPSVEIVLVSVASALVVSGYSVLTLWCPTRTHLALLVMASVLGISAVTMEHAGRVAAGAGAFTIPVIGLASCLLSLAAILVIEPKLNGDRPASPKAAWWVRPVFLGISLCGGCALLVLTLASPRFRLTVGEGAILGGVLLGTVGVRTFLNQLGMVRSSVELERALAEKEDAIASLRSAGDEVSASEAKLRRLLDSAVDGIVELDSAGAIVRANAAFCAMVRLPPNELVGQSWEAVVARAGSGAESLAALLESGQALVASEVGTSYLEARSSLLPTTPPGTLLLIRDVTSSEVAEQTIRTLFQFLQDRDEDRSRLLQRTSAAIEAERNRIARDLHDGPIQGISGAALSLEAVRLMLESGELERAVETVHIVSSELSDEARNLRRIMSDLRPPVLEERGLIPAVRELCERAERELGIPVTVIAAPDSHVPSDVETLAFRVIQEALSNVGKHAEATRAGVRVESTGGTLAVEVSDDGHGFDPLAAREFLRAGKVGLASMRERAELAGGTFTIRSQPGSGTTVKALLPYDVLSAPARRA
jgi:PAS domain S-box-containing protein